jgi:hypothetical protein
MKIKIKEKEIELKYSYRALMIYENIQKQSFNPKTLSDIIVFFYSVVVSSAKDRNILFDDFMDWLDENPNVITEFSNWLQSIFNMQATMSPDEQEKDDVKEEDEKN